MRVVNLERAAVRPWREPRRPFCIQITPVTGLTFELSSESQMDQSDWITVRCPCLPNHARLYSLTPPPQCISKATGVPPKSPRVASVDLTASASAVSPAEDASPPQKMKHTYSAPNLSRGSPTAAAAGSSSSPPAPRVVAPSPMAVSRSPSSVARSKLAEDRLGNLSHSGDRSAEPMKILHLYEKHRVSFGGLLRCRGTSAEAPLAGPSEPRRHLQGGVLSQLPGHYARAQF